MKGVGSTLKEVTTKFKEHSRSSRYYTMDDCIISNSITLILSSTIVVPLFKQTWTFLGWTPRLNVFKQAMYLKLFFLVHIVILILYSLGSLGIQSAHY